MAKCNVVDLMAKLSLLELILAAHCYKVHIHCHLSVVFVAKINNLKLKL